MKQNLKERVKNEIKTKYLLWIGILQILFVLLFIVSLFVMVWGPWSIAWRLCLTGLMGWIICYGVNAIATESINLSVDKYLNDNPIDEEKTLSFQQKLKALQEEHERTRKGAKA